MTNLQKFQLGSDNPFTCYKAGIEDVFHAMQKLVVPIGDRMMIARAMGLKEENVNELCFQGYLNPFEQPIKDRPGDRPINKFSLGDLVTKTKGSQWTGRVVGFYSTELTKEGYCVESQTEKGSVQIYPAAALELVK